MTKITSIEQFITKHFHKDSPTEYIVLEAKFLNSFFKRLADSGFNFISAHDGEENHKIIDNDRFKLLDVIFSVDEASVLMQSNNNEKFRLFMVMGNGDATTISDHSDLSPELEKFIFSEFAKSVKTHSQELYEMNWYGYANS